MEKKYLKINNMINGLELKNDEKYKEMSIKEEEKLFRSLFDYFEAISILLCKIVLIENLYNFKSNNLQKKNVQKQQI